MFQTFKTTLDEYIVESPGTGEALQPGLSLLKFSHSDKDVPPLARIGIFHRGPDDPVDILALSVGLGTTRPLGKDETAEYVKRIADEQGRDTVGAMDAAHVGLDIQTWAEDTIREHTSMLSTFPDPSEMKWQPDGELQMGMILLNALRSQGIPGLMGLVMGHPVFRAQINMDNNG